MKYVKEWTKQDGSQGTMVDQSEIRGVLTGVSMMMQDDMLKTVLVQLLDEWKEADDYAQSAFSSNTSTESTVKLG